MIGFGLLNIGSCPRVLQHPVDVQPVALGWVADEHVGYRADDPAILDNGAAAHALHDAAGDGQQVGVGDLDDHALGRGA